MSTQLQTRRERASASPFIPAQTRLLQCKCACGGSPGVDGECAECRSKRLGLQRHLLPPHLQTKLTVNQPGDIYEQEADRVAEQVMRMPAPNSSPFKVQGKQGEEQLYRLPMEDTEEEDALHAKEAPDQTPVVTPELQTRISAMRGGGQPLSEATRAFMEPRFGHDFSNVRVHTDAKAAESARVVNALAYTVGRDVVFGTGQYVPRTSEGKRLLAHGLAHIVHQQAMPFLIQRKDNDKGQRSSASSWTEMVRNAKAALAHHDMNVAEKLYRDAITIAASNATVPDGITRLEPKTEDIRLDLKPLSDIRSRFEPSAFAETRPDEIPKNETNYWHWIYFSSDVLMETQAHTEAVISHELIHVRQYQKLWNDYKTNKSTNKSTWKEFRKPFELSARVKGPEELEAEVTSLAFLGRLSPKEQELTLRGLLIAYISTSIYTPPKGEIPAITTTAALPQILDAFKGANPSLQGRMGEAVWWALMYVNPSKDKWLSVLRELKPLAIKGHSDPVYMQTYDRFLELTGLTFREIVSRP